MYAVTKWKGKNSKRPPPGEWNDSMFSSVCAFLGLLIIAYLHDMYEDEGLVSSDSDQPKVTRIKTRVCLH